MTMAKKEYIERKAIVEKLNEIGSWGSSSNEFLDGLIVGVRYAITLIMQAPTIDITSAKCGKWHSWLGIDNIFKSRRYYRCRACNKIFSFVTKRWQTSINMSPYCPNCGARMDGNADA